jgi:hypothetical protein
MKRDAGAVYPANFQKKYICSSKRPAAQTTPTIAPTTDLLSLPLAARSVPPTKNAVHFLFSASSAHVCSVVSHVSSFPSHWHVHFPKPLSSTGVSAVLAPLGLTCGNSESMRRRQRWNIVWSFLCISPFVQLPLPLFSRFSCFRF